MVQILKRNRESPAQAAEVDSLRRGLEILRCFDATERSLSLTELTRRTHTPRATAQKLLNTLVAHRFLRYLPALDRYEPDVSCFVVGHALRSSLKLLRVARAPMRELAQRLDLEVLAAVHDRLEMIVIECCAPHDDVGVYRPGTPMAVTASALGRAWLWAQRPAVQAQFIEQLRMSGEEGATRALPAIYGAFEQLERLGYCLSFGEPPHDRNVVATALAVEGRDNFISLACAAKKGHSSEAFLKESVGPALLEIAAQIVDELGKRGRRELT